MGADHTVTGSLIAGSSGPAAWIQRRLPRRASSIGERLTINGPG